MRLDQYNNPIYNSQDLFNLLYQNKEDSFTDLFVDIDDNIVQFTDISNIQFKVSPDLSISISDFDKQNQSTWFMPEEYKMFDIEEYIINRCPQEHYNRIIEELTEFRSRNMVDLLRWLKYFVDTCKQNNVVWGVGRGSSVASYVLFLLEVHCIDSIKYNLDWREFLR